MDDTQTIKSFLEESLRLSETNSFLEAEHYWKQSAASLHKLLEAQERIKELNAEEIALEQELAQIETSLQLLVVQDKRLTNETQRKTAISTLKLENGRWKQITQVQLPGVKSEIDSLRLSIHTLKKAYELCYAVVSIYGVN